MAAEWHYSKEGKQHGPVSASVLKNLAKTGNLLPTDLIWKGWGKRSQPPVAFVANAFGDTGYLDKSVNFLPKVWANAKALARRMRRDNCRAGGLPVGIITR